MSSEVLVYNVIDDNLQLEVYVLMMTYILFSPKLTLWHILLL